MSWTFEKVNVDLLDNKLLTANEKLIVILCKRFEHSPNGIRLSHKYLMQRTGIKSKRTLVKCMDRLVMFGYFAYFQPQKNRPNIFTFDNKLKQQFIAKNLARRKALSTAMKKVKGKGVKHKLVDNNVVKLKFTNPGGTKS